MIQIKKNIINENTAYYNISFVILTEKYFFTTFAFQLNQESEIGCEIKINKPAISVGS